MIKVDFSKVRDSVVAGTYIAKVKSIKQETSSTGGQYLKWELVVLTGASKGLTVNHITSLKPEALFNLRNTLIACGYNIPKSAVNVDINKCIGKMLGIEVTMREYEGNEYPNVKKTMSVEKAKVAMGVAPVEADVVDDSEPATTEDVGGLDEELPF